MKKGNPTARLLFLGLALGAVPIAAASPSAPKPAKPAAPAAARPAAPQAPAVPPAVLKDRIVAVVDEDPILVSDLDRAIALGYSPRRPGEAEGAFRHRALSELIDDRLRFHEIDRFGFEPVPAADIDQQIEVVRTRLGGDAALQKTLAGLGLNREALRQIVARQLLILTFAKERQGPKVFVDAKDIDAYYRNKLVPQMKRDGKTAPPVESVREEIRTLLQEERLNQEIEGWTKGLRAKADIANYLDHPLDKLPPVVKTLKPKPAPKGAAASPQRR